MSDVPKVDLHVHSRWSDGLLSPAAIVDRADYADLEVVAITDHYPALNNPLVALDQVPRTYAREIHALKPRALDHGTRLLVGIEYQVDAPALFPFEDLDLLLVEGLWGDPAPFFEKAVAIARAARKFHGPDFPVILAHPHFTTSYGKTSPMAPETLDPYVDMMERHRLVVELNTSYRNYEAEAILFEYLVQTSDVQFSLGSDAHQGSRVGQTAQAWAFLQCYSAEARFFLARDFGIT